jgi:hypothetical protein
MRLGLRSSPLFCALDTVMIIIKIISLVFAGCSWKAAISHTWWDRFPHNLDISIPIINESWALSVWAFILGALPQAVKIYAMSGIAWTQIIASIYLVSFITLEIVRFIAGSSRVGTREEVGLSPALSKSKSWLACIDHGLAFFADNCQICLLFGCFTGIFNSGFVFTAKLRWTADDRIPTIMVLPLATIQVSVVVTIFVLWRYVYMRSVGVPATAILNNRGPRNEQDAASGSIELQTARLAGDTSLRPSPQVEGMISQQI